MLCRPRVYEARTDERPEEREGSLAPGVGGVDVEPSIAEANLDGGVVGTVLGGADHNESPFLGRFPCDGLDDAGHEVGRGDLDAGREPLQNIVG